MRSLVIQLASLVLLAAQVYSLVVLFSFGAYQYTAIHFVALFFTKLILLWGSWLVFLLAWYKRNKDYFDLVALVIIVVLTIFSLADLSIRFFG